MEGIHALRLNTRFIREGASYSILTGIEIYIHFSVLNKKTISPIIYQPFQTISRLNAIDIERAD